MSVRSVGFVRDLAIFLALCLWAAPVDLVNGVRGAVAQRDFARAEAEIRAYRAQNGATPEVAEALSWIARGVFGAGSLDKADAYATETRNLAHDLLKTRPLDAEPRLPLALGAAIEVHAQVLAARGERGEAVEFLRHELETWRQTSIRTRIQKNLNLLNLVGKPPPPLDGSHWLGPKPVSLPALKGRPVLLFFWAHWCPDCKREAPDLARLVQAYRAKGLVIIGPTRHYGYAARGQEATPEQELHYIDEVRKQYYSALAAMPVPVGEENFKIYGASTVPTLVLIDRHGVVRMYHPGAMSYSELSAKLEQELRS